jgi:antitoxin component of RelBE/YafQ-DinJ toxin-antitoxin module
MGVMRQAIHTDTVRFRADPGLIERAEAKASNDGMTLSELIRQALRKELGRAA